MTAAALADRLGARRVGAEWSARCPVHDDAHASLNFRDRDGRLVVTCRAGCAQGDVWAALRSANPDLLGDPWRPSSAPARVTRYQIRDAAGELQAVHVREDRADSKRMWWETPTGARGLAGVRVVDLPLYRSEHLAELPGDVVVIVEGERAADAAAGYGLLSVGTVTGASATPSASALEVLRGRRVALWPDADPPGHLHMRRLARALHGIAESIAIVTTPHTAPKGWDCADLPTDCEGAVAAYTLVSLARPWDAAECDTHGSDSCDACHGPEQAEPEREAEPRAENPLIKSLVGAAELVAEGRRLRETGVSYVVDGIIPAYGMAGFVAGYAKVGKTSSFGLPLLRAVAARGDDEREFLGRRVTPCPALWVELENPRQYLGYQAAASLDGTEDLIFLTAPLTLDEKVMGWLEDLIAQLERRFVYVSTFAAGCSALMRDENDNAGMARVVETLKSSARRSGVPHLFEAHAGKGEDQGADADPIKSLRGASAAAAAADFVLNVRRDGAGATTRRTLSGAGRFVNFGSVSYDWDPLTGELEYLGSRKDAGVETTVRLIVETGAVVANELRSVSAIIRAAGLADKGDTRTAFRLALDKMQGVEKVVTAGRGGTTTRYRLTPEGDR